MQIGALRLGGLGDNLLLLPILAGVRRQFPRCRLTLYASRYPEVFRDCAAVDEVVTLAIHRNWAETLEELRPGFDVFYDLKYVGKAYYQAPSLAVERARYVRRHRRSWAFYYPDVSPAYTQLMGLGLHVLEVTARSVEVAASLEDMTVHLRPEEERFARSVVAGPYVTVHNWSHRGQSTKCWYADRWAEVARCLKSQGYEVVQVGPAGAERIPGTTNLLGATTFHQLAALIKNASLHLDVESGLVHLAKATATRSVVLFGPTSPALFGYAENVNLCAGLCPPCWQESANWFASCVRQQEHACMRRLTVPTVLGAVEQVLSPANLPVTRRPSIARRATPKQLTRRYVGMKEVACPVDRLLVVTPRRQCGIYEYVEMLQRELGGPTVRLDELRAAPQARIGHAQHHPHYFRLRLDETPDFAMTPKQWCTLARRKFERTIISFHNPGQAEGLAEIVHQAHACTVFTEVGRQIVRTRTGIEPRVIPHGMLPFCGTGRKPEVPGWPRVGYFGFLGRRKHLDDLLIAANGLASRPRFRNLSLVLLGSTWYTPDYLEFARWWRSLAPRVKYKTWIREFVDYPFVHDVLSACDVVVLPFDTTSGAGGDESLSIKSILAVGTPVITTVAPVTANLDRGVYKMVGPQPEYIVAAVEEVCDNQDLRQRLLAEAAEVCEQWSWKRVADRFRQLYADVVSL